MSNSENTKEKDAVASAVDAIVIPELTAIRDSQLQRERDVMSYIAETIELMGGDDGPELDTLANWLYRLRKKAMRA